MDGSLPRPTTRPSDLLLRSLRREHGFEPLRVTGTLPPTLAGTVLRVGPGSMDSLGVPVTHLFEAEGAVSAVRFRDGKAEGAIRMVDSEGRREEHVAGRPLHGFRAPYPTRVRSLLGGRTKNVANTSPLLFQGRAFALCEAFPPIEVDPISLETRGETDLGVIRGPFSAHPHRVASRRATYNFGLRYGRRTVLDLYELPDAGPPRHLGAVTLPRPVMLHDFVATDRHLVFFVSPMDVEILRAALAIAPFGKLFRYRPEHGTEILVVPIDAPAHVTRFEVPAFYQWHFANAFEGDDGIVVDFVRYTDASTFDRIGSDQPLGGTLVRTLVRAGERRLETLAELPGLLEFPSVDGRIAGAESRIVFGNSEAEGMRGIARIDLVTTEVRRFEDSDRRWYGEPVFVPSGPAEGEGHLVAMVLDADAGSTHAAVFDASRIEDGPVARCHFDEALPISFHGTFIPG